MTLKTRPIAVDLFAGAGGLSLGLEQAGFDVLVAVEIDPIHSCVHEYNFPHCHVLAQPIEKITGDDIRKTAGLSANETIDLVAGGAPCQGFSLIGQRVLDDPRNYLVKEYIRIIQELQPTYFLFENVKGLTIGQHRRFLDEIIASLTSLDYTLVQPWQVLNAKHFGVPQSRERLFLIGAKNGATLPQYPEPNTQSIVTCKEALADLPDVENYDALIDSDEMIFEHPTKISKYATMMRCTAKEAWKFGYQRRWNKKLLTNSIRTKHSDLSKRRFSATEPGTVERVSRFFKLPPDGVANTLRAGTDSARGAFTSPRPIHYEFSRCVTVREMARLHGFPDWFRFHVTKWHGGRQIGNSVPPPLAYAIGQSIIRASNYQPNQPEEVISLGKKNLLMMKMPAAARYWEMTSPIAKRNRNEKVKIVKK